MTARSMPHLPGGGGAPSALAPPAVAKAHRNLLPLFVGLVVVTYIDRCALQGGGHGGRGRGAAHKTDGGARGEGGVGGRVRAGRVGGWMYEAGRGCGCVLGLPCGGRADGPAWIKAAAQLFWAARGGASMTTPHPHPSFLPPPNSLRLPWPARRQDFPLVCSAAAVPPRVV